MNVYEYTAAERDFIKQTVEPTSVFVGSPIFDLPTLPVGEGIWIGGAAADAAIGKCGIPGECVISQASKIEGWDDCRTIEATWYGFDGEAWWRADHNYADTIKGYDNKGICFSGFALQLFPNSRPLGSRAGEDGRQGRVRIPKPDRKPRVVTNPRTRASSERTVNIQRAAGPVLANWLLSHPHVERRCL